MDVPIIPPRSNPKNGKKEYEEKVARKYL